MKHRTTSHRQYITNSCSTTLLVALAPITIYFLQLLGKVSTPAAIAAGILIIAKALIEWQLAMRRLSLASPTAPVTHQPETLVRVLQQPIAGCYLCKKQQPLLDYPLDKMEIGLCQDCYRCLDLTSHRL